VRARIRAAVSENPEAKQQAAAPRSAATRHRDSLEFGRRDEGGIRAPGKLRYGSIVMLARGVARLRMHAQS